MYRWHGRTPFSESFLLDWLSDEGRVLVSKIFTRKIFYIENIGLMLSLTSRAHSQQNMKQYSQILSCVCMSVWWQNLVCPLKIKLLSSQNLFTLCAHVCMHAQGCDLMWAVFAQLSTPKAETLSFLFTTCEWINQWVNE